MKLVFAYWDIRGLGESIRLFLRYLGEDFEDKRYNEWLSVKYSLGLDFP
uniref:GST N-terminal domain-containing protein n=1 Tax=Mesocestoides corti TaxID=53468 RepID=A0A5K3G2Q8_MESCO